MGNQYLKIKAAYTKQADGADVVQRYSIEYKSATGSDNTHISSTNETAGGNNPDNAFVAYELYQDSMNELNGFNDYNLNGELATHDDTGAALSDDVDASGGIKPRYYVNSFNTSIETSQGKIDLADWAADNTMALDESYRVNILGNGKLEIDGQSVAIVVTPEYQYYGRLRCLVAEPRRHEAELLRQEPGARGCPSRTPHSTPIDTWLAEACRPSHTQH